MAFARRRRHLAVGCDVNIYIDSSVVDPQGYVPVSKFLFDIVSKCWLCSRVSHALYTQTNGCSPTRRHRDKVMHGHSPIFLLSYRQVIVFVLKVHVVCSAYFHLAEHLRQSI